MKAQANSFSRRRFLETAIVGSIPVVFSGVGNLSPVVTGQGSCLSRSRNWDYSRLSTAVLNHVGREVGQVYNATQFRGSATANEVRTLATNLQLLFSHFDEIQLSPLLERHMRECRQELLDFVPTEEHLRQAQDRLVEFGVSIPVERLRQTLSAPNERKAQAMSQVERLSIQGFVKEGVKRLKRFANGMEQQNSRTMPVRYDRIPQDPAEFICDGLKLIDGILWLGCALGIVPYCVAAAVVAIIIAVLEAVDFC